MQCNNIQYNYAYLPLQIAYFGLCLPGFIAQFLPFMQRFKIQAVSNHVLFPIIRVHTASPAMCVNQYVLWMLVYVVCCRKNRRHSRDNGSALND